MDSCCAVLVALFKFSENLLRAIANVPDAGDHHVAQLEVVVQDHQVGNQALADPAAIAETQDSRNVARERRQREIQRHAGIEHAAKRFDQARGAPDIGMQHLTAFVEGPAKQALREYIDRGGFILASATCRGGDFDAGFRKLMDEIFAEPEYRLRLLSPDHAVWRAEEKVDPNHLRPLWGINYGCRTSVIYCPEDLSCYWELGGGRDESKMPATVRASVQAAKAIGVNVLTYATGREPKYKQLTTTAWKTEAAPKTTRGSLKIARLLHSGGCNAAPGAVANLLRQASRELSFPVDTQESELSITDPELLRHHLAFMHGRSRFRLSTDERKQLRLYLERRGTLLADAVCASREFTESFREEMRRVLPDAKLERIPIDDPLFTKIYGGYDIRQVSRHQPGSADGPLQARERRVEPLLEGLKLGDRYAVIFSPYDISCALEQHASIECHGYTRDDAAKIGLNVLLYSLHH